MVEKINITFLGTGSAVPTKKRNHPSVLIQYKDENILFDCGEGTQRQFRKANLNPCKITRVFLTHWHGDHVFGLPGLFQTLSMNNYNKTLHVYGPVGTEYFMKMYEKMYIKKNSTFYIETHEVGNQIVFENEEIKIDAKEMVHDSPCLAYSFIVKEKSRLDKTKLKKINIPENSPILGKLAKGETIEFNNEKIDGKKLLYKEQQRKITYVTDTKINQNIIPIAENSDILICESTYLESEEEQATEYAHMTSFQSAKIAKESKSKKLFLVHLSQRYDDPRQIKVEAQKIFKNTIIPEDLDKISI